MKTTLRSAIVVVMSLSIAALAWAYYPPDGTKPDGSGGYMNPGDGICVVGINLAGQMLVDWSIGNARDCVAWTKSADGAVDLVGMTSQDACTKAGFAGNDGYKHAWSTSLCYDTVNGTGVSRVDLDNTDAMCRSKGGTVVTTGKCVAYGWVYLNRRAADNALPISGTGVSTTDGVQAADLLGFCSTSVRMTGGDPTYTATTCPSYHNSPTTAPAEWPFCLSSTTGCQTQASYDAGLGWSWDATNSRCLYAYGVTGAINAAATRADGSTHAANSFQDLTTYTNQGDCLANGFAWDNWLPSGGTTVVTNAGGGDYDGMPDGAAIRRLDALTAIEDGGGDFYSGTGSVCLKCHSDQSRSYQERNKPGFHKTRHKLAGDAVGKPFQPFFTEAGSDWGLQGVQCSMCHSTAKPAQDDLIQVNPAGAPGEGNPKSATGHNVTEYGTHLIGICYTCHGTAATPVTTNPASVIPVSAGDFALTSKGLPPIANQFLNSPHAEYQGSSTKVDIGNKDNYGSSFEGYVCRTPATQFRNNAAPGNNSANCIAANHTWYTATGFGSFCYYDEDSCLALPTGQWTDTFDAAIYPWAAAAGGPGHLCYGIGIGSIITTVYREGLAEKIHNLDSTTNAACTNPADGSATSGAGGYWVKDGETSPGTPADTAQGNCMTCHDVHWALADTSPEAEPFRRECTSCHSHAAGDASAVSAPQIDLATINHLRTAGTPLEHAATEPNEACETCHMPRSAAGSSPMHLWRINTDPTYRTMGFTRANTTADGDYPDAAWVDLDHACGQCHGGSGAAQPGVPYFSTERLALVARGMHDGAGVSCSVTFSSTVSTLSVDVFPSVNCGAASITLGYDWDWGDGTLPHGTVQFDSHTYASGGTKTIVLTVLDSATGRMVGVSTRSVAITNPDLAPAIGGSCTTPPGTEWNANTWTMTIVDASSDDGPDADATPDANPNPSLRVILDWGDSSTRTFTTQGHTLTHVYTRAGTFPLNQIAIDSAGRSASAPCVTAATPESFTIRGTVKDSLGATPVAAATVQVRKAATGAIVKTTTTAANGQFSSGAILKPGLYNVVVIKAGSTFPLTAVQVGPSDLDFSRTILANSAGGSSADDVVVQPPTSGRPNLPTVRRGQRHD